MCYTLQGYTVYTIDSDLVILLDHLQLRSIYTLYEILLCSLHTPGFEQVKIMKEVVLINRKFRASR